jgi:Ca2+:H+ antiporter
MNLQWKKYELGTLRGDLQHILLRYANVLLVFVPIGFIVQYTEQAPAVLFAINLLAVLPSSIVMGIGLKRLREQYGAPVQAVLYMTFGYN